MFYQINEFDLRFYSCSKFSFCSIHSKAVNENIFVMKLLALYFADHFIILINKLDANLFLLITRKKRLFWSSLLAIRVKFLAWNRFTCSLKFILYIFCLSLRLFNWLRLMMIFIIFNICPILMKNKE